MLLFRSPFLIHVVIIYMSFPIAVEKVQDIIIEEVMEVV